VVVGGEGGDYGLVEGYVAILLPENWVPRSITRLAPGYQNTRKSEH